MNDHAMTDHVRARLHAKVREVFPQMPEFIPVKPVPSPTVEQNLAFALRDLAKCKARLRRMRGKALELKMWLDMGESQRALEAVNAIVLDL